MNFHVHRSESVKTRLNDQEIIRKVEHYIAMIQEKMRVILFSEELRVLLGHEQYIEIDYGATKQMATALYGEVPVQRAIILFSGDYNIVTEALYKPIILINENTIECWYSQPLGKI